MRSLCPILAALTVFAAALPAAWASDLPEFRPALMGTKGAFHRSLVNLIDGKGLVKKGQKDAVVLFTCAVLKSGQGGDILVYRGTPGSERLQKELLRLSHRASFNPAIYKHETVAVNFIGTVVFVVRDGQPHLRIYLHQQEEDFKSDADFVAPQLALPMKKGMHPYLGWPKEAPHDVEGAVALLNVDVDVSGKVTGANVAFEHPERMGFGREGVRFIRECVFIPGFHDGKMVPCRFAFPVFYSSRRHKFKIE